MFRFFSSDTLQVLMFVCPTVSELCFYGCCHPCFYKIAIQRGKQCLKVKNRFLSLSIFPANSPLTLASRCLFNCSWITCKKTLFTLKNIFLLAILTLQPSRLWLQYILINLAAAASPKPRSDYQRSFITFLFIY